MQTSLSTQSARFTHSLFSSIFAELMASSFPTPQPHARSLPGEDLRRSHRRLTADLRKKKNQQQKKGVHCTPHPPTSAHLPTEINSCGRAQREKKLPGIQITSSRSKLSLLISFLLP